MVRLTANEKDSRASLEMMIRESLTSPSHQSLVTSHQSLATSHFYSLFKYTFFITNIYPPLAKVTFST